MPKYWVNYDAQKCLKTFKKLDFQKIAQKVPKFFGGGGGIRPVLEETQIKAAFFLGKLPNTLLAFKAPINENCGNLYSSA